MAVVYKINKLAVLTGPNTPQKVGLPPLSLPANGSRSIETSGYSVAVFLENNKQAIQNELIFSKRSAYLLRRSLQKTQNRSKHLGIPSLLFKRATRWLD